MSKKYFILVSMLMFFCSGIAMADTVQQIQSPIYTDEIGRSHFLGKGGYSRTRQLQNEQFQADAVNDAVNNMSTQSQSVDSETENFNENTETDITKVIKENNNVPVSSKSKASFSSQERIMDPSASFGNGATYLPSSGVNDSKTIYTDELGRLHFFGKGNTVKE